MMSNIQNMIKTTTAICDTCIYHSGTYYGRVSCRYLEMTHERRGCPVGYCDKYERMASGMQGLLKRRITGKTLFANPMDWEFILAENHRRLKEEGMT